MILPSPSRLKPDQSRGFQAKPESAHHYLVDRMFSSHYESVSAVSIGFVGFCRSPLQEVSGTSFQVSKFSPEMVSTTVTVEKPVETEMKLLMATAVPRQDILSYLISTMCQSRCSLFFFSFAMIHSWYPLSSWLLSFLLVAY